jgi:phytoene synthase
MAVVQYLRQQAEMHGLVKHPITLQESYADCCRITKTRAKNFYYSFLLLSREQRNAMCAIYAFMRHCDDLSDEPGASLEALEEWQRTLSVAFAGGPLDAHPVLPALMDTVARYRIPRNYLYEMIEGVLSDLTHQRFNTFDELHQYCYKVASVVGLTIIHIFGFEAPEALELAEKCGIAFQLTNILRDVREDAERGRQYLPTEDLTRFGVAPEELRSGLHTPNFTELMRFEADRARRYYDESLPLLELVHARSRSSLWALITVYSRVLDRIRKKGYTVLSGRISLSGWEKSLILMQAFARI